MVAMWATAHVLAIVWLVTRCATSIAEKTGSHETRLVRRATRKRRGAGGSDTVVAQIQPQGDVVSPHLVEHSDGVDLDERAATRVASPTGVEENHGPGEVRKPLTTRVAESMSKAVAGSWVQAALSSLKEQTNDGIASHRKVKRRRNRLMRIVAHADGDTEKIGKPTEEDIAELDNVERPADFPNAHAGKLIIEHKFRGCFPLPDDRDSASAFHDLACMNATEGVMPCRGGLPFFRLPMAAGQSYLDCFTFCLSKGLDLSGIVNFGKNKECRCGATVENAGAWHRQQPKSQLLLTSNKLKADDPNCRLLVWEYTGGLTDDDSVPYPLVQMSDDDRKYMESIAMGHDVTQEQGAGDEMETNITDINITIDDDRVQPNASLLKMSGVCRDDPRSNCASRKSLCQSAEYGRFIRASCPLTCGICTKQGGFLNCYPHNCAGGGGPWLTKRSDGNAYIPYMFANNVDNARKNVFKRAIYEYHQKTCIRWVSSASSVHPRVIVGIYDLRSCTAGVGYPGPTGTVRINLGWCKDHQSLGAVIHEMGHAIGMNHEQNRMDGASRAVIDGKYRGPHLRVRWYNIPSQWKPQYVPKSDTYVGSAYDGNGDHWWGYSGYDFHSIMHYYRESKYYDTIPSSYNSVVGQRALLSSGDIRQIKDMYQCGKPPSPTPPPSTTQRPTPKPGPCDWWCRFTFGLYCGRQCSGCPKCTSALLAKEIIQNSNVAHDASLMLGASANESVDREDPEDEVAIWVADAWGACKKGAVICTRTREVVCENPNGKEIKETNCDPSQKPVLEQACYCSEITELPQACARKDSAFGGKNCTMWRGLDCLTIDDSRELQASCPHTCGLC